MYVWLELILEQQKASEVRQFLESVDADQLSITEFALNSIGLITTRLKKQDVFGTPHGDPAVIIPPRSGSYLSAAGI